MQASQQVYEDAQYQSSDPIGYQPPIPAGVHDIELSWDRKRGYMRVIIDGATWHFKEYLGKAEVTREKGVSPPTIASATAVSPRSGDCVTRGWTGITQRHCGSPRITLAT